MKYPSISIQSTQSDILCYKYQGVLVVCIAEGPLSIILYKTPDFEGTLGREKGTRTKLRRYVYWPHPIYGHWGYIAGCRVHSLRQILHRYSVSVSTYIGTCTTCCSVRPFRLFGMGLHGPPCDRINIYSMWWTISTTTYPHAVETPGANGMGVIRCLQMYSISFPFGRRLRFF